jgi:NhaP-type Na+/H+ or K+/H+ antiporter/Trk K+ transport system NAD-binding subunit
MTAAEALAFTPHPALALVLTTAVVLVAGALGQAIGRRSGVPAMVFLLAFGIALGPSGLGLVRPEVYGEGLRALISCAVAVIVFEGALAIDVRQLRHCSRGVLGLISVGAGVTFLLGGVAAHYLAGLPWKIAFLYGAIVSVTGPTVVTPILKRLPLGHRLKTTLEAESVFVDAVGVLLAAAVFSYITGSGASVGGGLAQLGLNLAIGVAVGATTAVALRESLARTTGGGDLARLIALGGVLLGYAFAESLAHESGIAAVAVAGLLSGTMGLKHLETVKQFKGDLTLVALSLVFILLAAGIELDRLVALGWGGLATVAALMLLVRPIAVVAATWGTPLMWRERAFIAWMGPRGIVAASMASLFALELKAWDVQGGDPIAPLVFLTVMVTVLIEGSLAGRVAAWLGVMPKKIVVVGADDVARRLAQQLMSEGESVLVLDTDADLVRLAAEAGLGAMRGDAADPGVLRKAGLGWCQVLVAATPSDKANLMVGQSVRAHYPDVRVIARLSDPARAEAFGAAGIETLSLADAAAMSLSMLVTHPNTLPLLGFMQAHPDKIVEVRVGNAAYGAQPLRALDLPKDCLVALVRRAGEVSVPDGNTRLQVGDVVTLVGQVEAVDRLRLKLEGDY